MSERPAGSAAEGTPVAIGHRGAPRLALENTPESFLLAAAHGAHWVELDVHLTADRRLVVAHDPTLLRLWGVDRPIAGMTMAEVDAATGGQARPLPEILTANHAHGLTSVIDSTTPDIAEAAATTVAAMTSLPTRATGFTGDPEGLRLVRANLPGTTMLFTWKSAALPEPGTPDGDLLAACRPQYVNLDQALLTPEAGQVLRGRGYRVAAYTVNTAADIDAVLEMGVDAVTSDDIDTLLTRISAVAPGPDAPSRVERRPAPPTPTSFGHGDSWTSTMRADRPRLLTTRTRTWRGSHPGARTGSRQRWPGSSARRTSSPWCGSSPAW